MKDGKIRSFVLDDILYICHEEDDNMRHYCNSINEQYTGQTIQKYVKPKLKDIPISFMNHQVLTALTSPMVKHRVHIGNPYNRENKIDDVQIDINKCYRSCIQMPYDAFMQIEFDTVIEYKKFDNSFGLWYVKTNDMTLLHGTNWYSNTIIQLAKDSNIPFECIHFIPGKIAKMQSNKMTNFSFNDIIKDLEAEFKGNSKMAINSIVGYLAQTYVNNTSLYVTADFEDVIPCMKKKNPIVINDDDLYLFGLEKKYYMHKNYLPIWIQILDWSNIRLHNLIMEHGSYDNLVYRRTDMAVMRKCNVNTSTDIGGYKIETKVVHQLTYHPIRIAELHISNQKWNIIKPENIFDHINSGKSLLITGRAGTGKSYYINEYSKNYTTVRLAFTNKASNNIKGTTLHKFFNVDHEYNATKSIKSNAIFVDEISMIPEFLWSYLIDLKNQCNVPIVIVGDDRQLPPIEEESHFNNPSIKWIADYNTVELTEMQRYDKALWDFLENPYQLPESEFNPNAMHICHTNDCVNKINRKMNDIHVPDPDIIVGNMRLFKDVPLLGLHTSNFIIKNETYTIFDIRAQSIIVEDNNGHQIEIKNKDFEKYFTLGYAMTTHKLQGSTIEGEVQVHEINLWRRNTDFGRRLFYTAYSRAKKLSNISISKYV